MTKKLEDLLNMPDSKEIVDGAKEEEDNNDKKEQKSSAQKDVIRDMSEFDKITEALPAVKGLGDMADNELNDVSDKAMTAYEDLMDLGMNVESRYSGRIFEVAGSMLKTGLDAKTAKLDKKLKMIELQLKKEKQDKDTKLEGDENIVNGDGYVVTDRNSLLERLKGLDKDK
jgi:hypothetical protein